MATSGTGAFFQENGVLVDVLDKISESDNNAVTAIRTGKLQLAVNTARPEGSAQSDGRAIRNAAIENAVPLFTAFDTVAALLSVLEAQGFTVNNMK
mgnify:FL=1